MTEQPTPDRTGRRQPPAEPLSVGAAWSAKGASRGRCVADAAGTGRPDNGSPGRKTPAERREEVLRTIAEAQCHGITLERACTQAGATCASTWRLKALDDSEHPRASHINEAERADTAPGKPRFADKTATHIAVTPADEGRRLCGAATLSRIRRRSRAVSRRGRRAEAAATVHTRPQAGVGAGHHLADTDGQRTPRRDVCGGGSPRRKTVRWRRTGPGMPRTPITARQPRQTPGTGRLATRGRGEACRDPGAIPALPPPGNGHNPRLGNSGWTSQ